jgi:hypothetical protein
MMLRALRCTIFRPCRGPAASALVRFVLVLELVCLCLAGSCWLWILISESCRSEPVLFWRRHAPPRLDGVLSAFGIGSENPFPFATRWRGTSETRLEAILFLASNLEIRAREANENASAVQSHRPQAVALGAPQRGS